MNVIIILVKKKYVLVKRNATNKITSQIGKKKKKKTWQMDYF